MSRNPVIKYLDGGTEVVIAEQIPPTALSTKFYNEFGNQLFLVGTPEQIAAADALMQNSPVVFDGVEYNFVP
jgi:hypothetical protein